MSFDKAKYKAYDSSGDELKDGRRSVCYSQCICRNTKNNTNPNNFDITTPLTMLDPEMGFQNSSGEFNNDLWSIVVVIIASSGAFATLCLMLYIMTKVCAGALVRRYLVLGVMLLVAMIFLFMSVLPFVFTPSEAVCGMRYFAHGVSYALCFAIILTKMTTLRDYKYIGLGGEISRVNQLFSVFFITGVQIAIGVEWWVLRTPVVIKETNTTLVGDIFDITYRLDTIYACDFERNDFLAYHSFVIFLIFVCCLYSIGVREETQNMKEARLLLISSWFCFAIWIALIVTISVMDRDYIEAICAIGILANALTLMVVIYFPKLTAISRLRYEVSDQNGVKESGYKVDRDFHFERPYSLPGTLHSHVTDKSLSYQRSLAIFDTSLSY